MVVAAAVTTRCLNAAPPPHQISTCQCDELYNNEAVRDGWQHLRLSAKWISITSRWGIYITSLLCISFCFRSYFSICFTRFLFSSPSSLPSIFSSLSFSPSSVLPVCWCLFTFCQTNHSFNLPSVFSVSSITLSASPTACVSGGPSVSLCGLWPHADPV